MKIKTFYDKFYPCDLVLYNHLVSDVTDCSYKVTKNACFVAIKGYTNDGHQYILEAINKGAKTIIINETYNFNYPGINIIRSSSPKKDLARLLKLFYNERLIPKIIGVTGTNGKTTTTTILYEYLKTQLKDVLLIGSNGIKKYYGFRETLCKSVNTTPNLNEIYHLIYENDFNYDYVIIEVSSQGLTEGRVLGLPFYKVIITNITSDHLDYHLSVRSYKEAKGAILKQVINEFNNDYNPSIILNKKLNFYNYFNELTTNKVFNYELINKIPKRMNQYTLYAKLINTQIEGSKGEFYYLNKCYKFSTNLIGNFNIENILSVASVLITLNYSLESFIVFLKNKITIQGRVNIIKYNNVYYLIDYAHNTSGVEEMLKLAQSLKKGQVITLIGCGGDRDLIKRPIMGHLVSENSDFVIFTEDNSRSEEPYEIIASMVKGVNKHNFQVIVDRKAALLQAVNMAKENDIVLILGKGAEQNIIKNDQYYHFNDEEVLIELLEEQAIE